MRIQILPLPSIVVGDDMEEPFALIVDQHDVEMDEQTIEEWHRFKENAGARALLVTPDTVDVVDKYAAHAVTPGHLSDTTIEGTLLNKPIRVEWPDGLPCGFSRNAFRQAMHKLAELTLGEAAGGRSDG